MNENDCEDEVLRLHEAIKRYGYFHCDWPPEEEEGHFALLYSALEQLKRARDERLAVYGKTLQETRESRELVNTMWDNVIRQTPPPPPQNERIKKGG